MRLQAIYHHHDVIRILVYWQKQGWQGRLANSLKNSALSKEGCSPTIYSGCYQHQAAVPAVVSARLRLCRSASLHSHAAGSQLQLYGSTDRIPMNVSPQSKKSKHSSPSDHQRTGPNKATRVLQDETISTLAPTNCLSVFKSNPFATLQTAHVNNQIFCIGKYFRADSSVGRY